MLHKIIGPNRCWLCMACEYYADYVYEADSIRPSRYC
jgi:hypothetical protein